jgi:hypothetical protein
VWLVRPVDAVFNFGEDHSTGVHQAKVHGTSLGTLDEVVSALRYKTPLALPSCLAAWLHTILK